MEVVINDCCGGFGLSLKATKRYCDLAGLECYFYDRDFHVHHKISVDDATDTCVITTKDFGEVYSDDTPNNELSNARFCDWMIERDDPALIQTIKELGCSANDQLSKLKIVTIPDDVAWYVSEDEQGYESVVEVHRVWR